MNSYAPTSCCTCNANGHDWALKLVFVVVSPYFFSLISFPCLGLPYLFLSTALLYISSLSPSSNTIGTLLIVSVAAAGRIISRDSCVWCRLQLWSIREPPCCWHVSCLSVSYLFWLSLALLCFSFPRRYFAPQSHLHIGLPFWTSIPCPQLEQVMIRLVLFLPTLRVVSFTISVHKETTKLFPIFLKIVLLFTFLLYHSIFFLFHCVTLHPNHISISDAIWNTPFHCLQAQQVGATVLWWITFRDSCMLFLSRSLSHQHVLYAIARWTIFHSELWVHISEMTFFTCSPIHLIEFFTELIYFSRVNAKPWSNGNNRASSCRDPWPVDQVLMVSQIVWL